MNKTPGKFARWWAKLWMLVSQVSPLPGPFIRLAVLFAPPHKERVFISRLVRGGYISPKVTQYCHDLKLGKHVFVDDEVVLFQRPSGGRISIGERVCIYRNTVIETGWGGQLTIGDESSIHPRCQINAHVGSIHIGKDVMLAPNCALYPYDHGILPDQPISQQPLQSKGDIVIEDGAWLGYGVIVLANVTIGAGAVIGAGSLVKDNIPAGAIAVGNPARIVKMRHELSAIS